jgi:hypothetical protein
MSEDSISFMMQLGLCGVLAGGIAIYGGIRLKDGWMLFPGIIGVLIGAVLLIGGSVEYQSQTREECGVVGTPEHAEYVCVEVTE